MNGEPQLQPLSQKRRSYIFYGLIALFVSILPFLYLYATGYRFDFDGETTFVSTGGMYVAAERTGAAIYIDNELVRETRVFRRAFYAQSLNPGTHRVHVQKENHHTWVKELPVYPHIVTEAQAFNLPVVPEARIISPRTSLLGAVVNSTSSLLTPSTTNPIVVATSTATSTYQINEEYTNLISLFSATSAPTTTPTLRERITNQIDTILATTTATSSENATTTIVTHDTLLYEDDGDIFAAWIGTREEMPYYYCAEPFDRYSTSTEKINAEVEQERTEELRANTAELLHPVQIVPEDAVCDPVIKIDRKSQQISYFNFLPNSTDFVVLGLENGIYLVEVDNRAWQNVQPLMLGEGLEVRVENGNIYIYDGALIYQIVLSD